MPKQRAQKLVSPLAEVAAVYRDLEARPIERSCQLRGDCCRFRLTGRKPMLTKGEALFAAKALRASGRKKLPESTNGACPLLTPDGACLIHAARPFGCRTHFCAAAGGPYARGEVIDLIRRLETIDEQLQGDGPRGIEDAVSDALHEI